MMRNLWIFGLAIAGAMALSGCGETLCQEGATQSCKTACGTGTEVCVNNAWANCDAPKTDREVCDGVDNDCNGQTDETCECIVGLTEKCYDGATGTETKGKCKTGNHTCVAGHWGLCEGQVVPDNSETCDGVDNNCDGTTDEGCTCVHGKSEACFSGPDSARNKGKCKDGTHICNMGVWGACLGEVLPDASEACDGVDNNCDGRADEGCSCTDGTKQSCTSACGKGEAICVGGEWKNCTAPQPQAEVCDGLDNNCNGSVDETCQCVVGKTEACFEGAAGNRNKGACKDGQHTCTATGWGTCIGQVLPTATDDCSDALDNDCDGIVNDGCTCTLGTTQKCGSSVGECKQGDQTCKSGGATNVWGDCINQTVAVAETCDFKDNDCNGKTDDGLDQDESDPNETCTAAKQVTVSDTTTTTTELSYTIYPTGDVDYLAITALDDLATLTCTFNPGKPKCNYLDVELVQPAVTGVKYQATLFTAACDDSVAANNVVLTSTSATASFFWEGICGLGNSASLWVKIAPATGSSPAFTCKPYTLKLTHTRYDNEACPTP